MKRKKSYDKSVYRSLTLITQFGINMIVPIAMMCALGIWLDGHFNTNWITPVLFFVGAIAGGQNIYRMAKSIYGKDVKKDDAHRQDEKHKQDTP